MIFIRAMIMGLIFSSFYVIAEESKKMFEETELENYSQGNCPADDFKSFIAQFSNSTATQEKYTSHLITELWIKVELVSEPTPFIKTYKKSKINFPIIPNATERKIRGLNFKPIDDEDNSATLISENTGYRVRYVFLQGACWYLIGIENLSI
jgi:hypothetical protein